MLFDVFDFVPVVVALKLVSELKPVCIILSWVFDGVIPILADNIIWSSTVGWEPADLDEPIPAPFGTNTLFSTKSPEENEIDFWCDAADVGVPVIPSDVIFATVLVPKYKGSNK